MGQKSKGKSSRSNHAQNSKRRFFPSRKPYVIALLIMAVVTIAFFCMMIIADILPPDVTVILSVAAVALLTLTCSMFASRYRWKRIIGIVIAICFIGALGFVTDFMRSTVSMLHRMGSSTAEAVGPASKGVDVTEAPFNVYITGIDQWESEKGLDLERSDVNMIMTINPSTKKVLLTSIPRDTYVKLHTAQQMDKLTHTGVYGVEETLSTVEDWLGIDINYYVKMNFTGAKDIINAMDGIKVYSPVAFESSLKGYKYKKGWNRMGGKKALYFARERHAFEGQDSIRVENQQRVIKAVIKKMTSSSTMITKYGDIMAAAGDNLSTNMSAAEMSALAKMQLAELCPWDVETQKIEGEYDMDYVASLTQSQKFSVYRADPTSVTKCTSEISDIMNPTVSEVAGAERARSKSFVVNLINNAISRITNRDE